MSLFSNMEQKSSPRGPPPPPPPPTPPPSLSTRQPQNVRKPEKVLYPPGTIAIGIETEFLLLPRDRNLARENIRDFSRAVAEGYKEFIHGQSDKHPLMHNAINESYLGERFSEWSLDSDITIEMPRPGQEPWGLENISPIFRVYQNSAWRNHIQTMWNYLNIKYEISANSSCGTHVHISLAEGYSLPALKQVCQSIIHFEPAFEAILPKSRLGNEYARSNWLDNPNFAYKRLSREQSMAVIAKCTSVRDLVLLMNPNHDKFFGWNFLYLLNSPLGTIEFRRGAASTSVEDVFMWVELAMSFVQSSIVNGHIDKLLKVPATIGGLKWFINEARLPQQPGVFDSRFLDLLLNEMDPNLTREPSPLGKLSTEKLEKLEKKKAEDKGKNIMLAKISQAPYWG